MKPRKVHYTSLFSHIPDTKPRFPRLNFFLMTNLPFLRQAFRKTSGQTLAFNEALASRKKSDTIFIFGSGYSVNDMSNEEWGSIREHNTLSFNWFIYQDFVPIDYHLVRETYAYAKTFEELRAVGTHYVDVLLSNPHYEKTILLIQGGRSAISGNYIVGYHDLGEDRVIARFATKSKSLYEPPTRDPAQGLVHGPGSLIDSINAAILGDWKHIVLVGVDLYDRRYFWLEPDQNDGAREPEKGVDVLHSTAQNGILDHVAKWQELMKKEGRVISIYNPKSLLNRVLPVYETTLRTWA